MRVLYVDQTGKLGGGELAILPWICHAREGAAVVLLEDGPFRSLLEECDVPVEVIDLQTLKGVRRESGVGGVLRSIPGFWRVRGRLKAKAAGFDVLYANSQKAFLLCALAKRKRQPLVWHLRDIMTAEHFSPLLRKIAVAAGNRFAAVVVTNSQATADSFVASGGKADKVRVVHDGVSAEPFDRVTAGEIDAFREKIPAPPEAKLVGLFGRISHWKGQHILLEALRELPEVHAVLVGDALFGEEAYAARLRTLASEPKLAGRIHFMGFRRDIPAGMKAMDVIVHTSTAPEPFGLVLVEGMLAGKPVIATAAGGALEILRGGADGDAGLLTAPGAVEELRDAIQFLLANPNERRNLAQRGSRRARAGFSEERLFLALHDIVSSLKDTSSAR